MRLFAVATLSPFLLLGLACFGGAPWSWLALAWVTVLVFVLDRWVPVALQNADPAAEFPGSERLLVALGVAHFIALALCLWGIAGESGLSGVERVVIALAAGLTLGQISHPVAHELIHRSDRRLRLLGRWIYISVLFGHHASAHLRVHHVHVGSKADPNSARWGEGVYRFMLRAWPGGFRAGLRAENQLRRGQAGFDLRHPYLHYVGGAAGFLILAYITWGSTGLFTYVFIAGYAQTQILLSDYVQHYGLRREVQADGTLEPVGPQHSWNAPQWASAAMTLNAPRHSDHHVTPARPYPALQLNADAMPFLPRSLPVMAAIALVPPLWRRMMDPLCAEWQARGNSPAG